MNLNEYTTIINGYNPYKLGIIQSRGVGDAFIAIPIAKHFYSLGHEVHFVIDQQYVEAMSYAFPYIIFHGIYDKEENLIGNIQNPYWYETPKKILEDVGCDKIMSFPFDELIMKSHNMTGVEGRLDGEFEKKAVDKNLAFHLGFDQIKYGIAEVPFGEKWNLDIRRNYQREYAFFNKIVKSPNYIVVHTVVNNGNISVKIENYDYFKQLYGNDLQIIPLDKLTDNIFDWLTVIEKATAFVAIDSSYVNLIDQLGFKNDKFYIQRASANTGRAPILKEKWNYVRGV